MMRLERRSVFGWGATAAGYASAHLGLVIHYDGSNQGLAGKSHSACRTYWRRTRSFHMGPSRRWVDIGYSFGVCPHGIVLEGRGARRSQAAQPGGNTTWTSCTLMGGPGDAITAAQIEGVRQLRAWLRKNHGLGTGIRGHRDFVSTSCPGSKAYALVRNGTFGKAPGAGGAGGGVEDELIGLKKGDKGERVKGLQACLVYAGFDLPKHGVDGDFGQETADALLTARKSVGSTVDKAETVTGYAYAQLMMAMAKAHSGEGSASIPRDLTVRSLTAQRLTVGS